ncbi:hypothetical protein E2C01_049725 [Portunus trituberculatus]|uniref:Uncharacterized protein n=1 Tax=Portunus trituberculatus TaxID=210409 RepID=A0A5B7G758_PORTR|nr:hypothetical protein [Portunus trituberculatus]
MHQQTEQLTEVLLDAEVRWVPRKQHGAALLSTSTACSAFTGGTQCSELKFARKMQRPIWRLSKHGPGSSGWKIKKRKLIDGHMCSKQ